MPQLFPSQARSPKTVAPIFVAPVAPDLKDRRCSVCVSRSVLPFYPVG